MSEDMKRVAVVIGAGPAGLTAASELLDKTDIHPLVLEQSDEIGGISKTVRYKGNRMDIGGHRFFSKSRRVTDFWDKTMPQQGSPSKDDLLIGRQPQMAAGGPDPEQTDRVMLGRGRVSRIFYLRKFFDYPITLKVDTFRNMGLKDTMEAGFSYAGSLVRKRKENSLEDFYINRFGKKLYSMFFENYTENLWGRHPSEIDPSWGAQRVKGLSIFAVLKNALEKQFGRKDREIETSLIEEFSYPKLGPGELWDVTAEEVVRMGGTILKNTKVTGIRKGEDNRLTGVIAVTDGTETEYAASTKAFMPTVSN